MSEKQIDQYTTLKLEERGKYGYSLIEGWVGREGDFKPSFCSRKIGKDREEKTIPVNVKLGNREKVKEVAFWLLDEIGYEFKVDNKVVSSMNTAEDVPF